jgi:protein gp37
VLRSIPAVVRFLSCEPLLEDLGALDLTGVDWVICGGESGPGARMMKPAWARSIRDQCAAAGVSFFMKQMTGRAPIPEDLCVRQFPVEALCAAA